MLVSPTNNVIVTVKPKWIRHISSIMKIAAITDESAINPADIVNIVGEVVSLPKKIETNKREYKGFSTDDIQVGDMAIFSYRVIFDLVPPKIQEKDDTIEPVYRNRFFYKGEEYFCADITNIFAVIRNGKIIMVNGYVMLEEYSEQLIILPQYFRRNRRTAESVITNIGNPKVGKNASDAKDLDTVLFHDRAAQHYKVNEKVFIILQQDNLLAKMV